MSMLMPSIAIRWLLEPAGRENTQEIGGHQDPSRIAFSMPGNIGQVRIETLPLATGMALVHGEHRFASQSPQSQVTMAEVRSEPTEPSLIVHAASGAQVIHREP